MPNDPEKNLTELVLKGLTEATKAQSSVVKRLDTNENRMESMEDTMRDKFGLFDSQMGSMNAHLDNLIRTVEQTNEILRGDALDRKAETTRRQAIEAEERSHRQKLEIITAEKAEAEQKRLQALTDDNRASFKKAVAAMWELFKQPVAYLLTAISLYLGYMYLETPKKNNTVEAVQLYGNSNTTPQKQ